MARILSLRGVISTIAALSVAVVAAVTLGLTLTSSLRALRDVASGHTLALTMNAVVKAEHMLGRPQAAIEVIQNYTRSEPWPHPSDDPRVLDVQLSTVTALAIQEHLDISMQVFYSDNTAISFVRTTEEYALRSVRTWTSITAVNGVWALQNFSTSMRDVYYPSNVSKMPPTDPRFDGLFSSSPPSKVRLGPIWDAAIVRPTLNGTTSINYGTVAARNPQGNLTAYIGYMGPVYRAGDAMVAPNLYAGVVAGISFRELNAFMVQARATPNTAAFVVDNLGFLMASSMNTPFEAQNTTVQTTFGFAQIAPGCVSEVSGRPVPPGTPVVTVCRTHASRYGFAPLAAVIEDAGLAFARTPTVQRIDVDGESYFTASAPVPQRFAGWEPQLLLLMPEEDVIGDVVATRNRTIGIICAIFVVVAVTTFVAISVLLAPLTDVAERMVRAANFEEDTDDAGVSPMAEVANLQEAYYAMRDELNRIRAFVPQSVLVAKKAMQAGELEEEEEDEGELEENDRSAPSVRSDSGRASVSSRSSRRSRRTRNSGSAAAGGTETGSTCSHVVAVPLAVSSRNVAVLVANVRDFAAFADRTSAADVADSIASVVDRVYGAVSDCGGVLGAFHGDRFTATFNAVVPCVGPIRKAALAATNLADADVSGLQLTCGVSSGPCLVGNVGGAAAKAFSTIGPAFPQAVALERLTRLYGAGCRVLATARVCNDVSASLAIRFIDIIALPGKPASLIGTISQRARRATGTSSVNDDEWLYVVGKNDAADETPVNEAFVQLHRGRLAACGEILEKLKAGTDQPDGAEPGPEPGRDAPMGMPNVTEAYGDTAEARVRLLYRRAQQQAQERASAGTTADEHQQHFVPPVSALPHFYDRVVAPGMSVHA